MKKNVTIAIFIFLLPFSLTVSADTVHTIRKNETLYGIAKEYSTTVDSLIELNRIEDPTKLYVGMEIVIRKETKGQSSYKAQKGDTLYGIARKHSVSLDSLLELNGITKEYLLKVGDILFIPGIGKSKTVSVKEDTEKEEATETEEPRKTEEMSTEDDHTWPILGIQVAAEGKLSGVYIKGVMGDPVRSISSGTVVWVGPYRGFGKVILVQSTNKYVYVYGSNAETKVKVGDKVTPGMIISTLGTNPHTKKPELFFAVFRDGKPVDPEEAPRA